jgi:hypothetical protein
MVDLADFLIITGPDGESVELTVDEILTDPAVMSAIEWRAEGGDLTPVPPGGKLVYRLPEFNRGWARYRLLEAGRYTVRLLYAPDWEDPEFVEAGVGRVESEPVMLEVTAPAPEIVRQSNSAARLQVTREGDELVARLTCTDDLPIWINQNLATHQPPFASLTWMALGPVNQLDVSPRLESTDDSIQAFQRVRVSEVQPGETIVLSRLSLAQAQASIQDRKFDATQLTLQASYTNQCSVVWQRQQEPTLLGNENVPPDLRSPLPRRLYTGRITSEPIELPAPKPAPAADGPGDPGK